MIKGAARGFGGCGGIDRSVADSCGRPVCVSIALRIVDPEAGGGRRFGRLSPSHEGLFLVAAKAHKILIDDRHSMTSLRSIGPVFEEIEGPNRNRHVIDFFGQGFV